MTMITPSYLGETIEYSSLHACRSTLEDPTRDALGEQSALLVANPLPPDEQLDPGVLNAALADALAAADAQGIRGKAVSPFLLDRILRQSGGKSLEVNLRLARSNVRLASKISSILAERH